MKERTIAAIHEGESLALLQYQRLFWNTEVGCGVDVVRLIAVADGWVSDEGAIHLCSAPMTAFSCCQRLCRADMAAEHNSKYMSSL